MYSIPMSFHTKSTLSTIKFILRVSECSTKKSLPSFRTLEEVISCIFNQVRQLDSSGFSLRQKLKQTTHFEYILMKEHLTGQPSLSTHSSGVSYSLVCTTNSRQRKSLPNYIDHSQLRTFSITSLR